MRFFPLLLALLLAACAHQPKAAETARVDYRLVDLTSAYAELWDESRALPAAERVAAFKARMEPLFPGYYSAERAGLPADFYDRLIGESFDQFPAIREDYAARAAAFGGMFDSALASFQRHFPDLGPIGPMYLIHSVGELDGGTRSIGGGPSVLVFGVDVMARVHDFTDEQPFLHHELFHVYHSQHFDGCAEAWCGVWSEGLAVQAAATLNPDATQAQLLLTQPEPLAARVAANRTRAICAVRERLDSTEASDRAALFSNQPLAPDLPGRLGYYIGYLAAAEAARERPIGELARLSAAEAEPVIKAAFDRLADCG